MNRRKFLATVGLASVPALAAGNLVLARGAVPTETSGELGAYGDYLSSRGLLAVTPPVTQAKAAGPALPAPFAVTENNIEGPFYRAGAPTRYTITQPYEPGVVMVVSGRVWGFNTKKPLTNAVLHIWQADEKGHYDNDDPQNQPAKDEFVNRAIIFPDASGRYEYQTIHPGAYQIGPKEWRPAHIHYMVSAPGYETLITQLYFDGDPHNAADRFIKKSLIIKLASTKRHGKNYERGVFDIVLKPKP
jgi:catechol 1,2-dioxygenase